MAERAKRFVRIVQDVPADAFASVVAFDLQVSNPTDEPSRFRHLRIEFATPIGFRKTTCPGVPATSCLIAPLSR